MPANACVEFCFDEFVNGGNSSRGNGSIPVTVSQKSVIASRYRCLLSVSGMPYIETGL